jgi:hypothetical protein
MVSGGFGVITGLSVIWSILNESHDAKSSNIGILAESHELIFIESTHVKETGTG